MNRYTSHIRPLCVIIDGRSGAGKTTLAEQIVAQLDQPAECTPAQVIHLEDLYDGWGGLAAATGTLEQLLRNHSGYHPYDWYAGRYSARWVPLDTTRHLVIEGCGAITPDIIRAAEQTFTVITVDVDAPESTRRQRALTRSPEMRPYWDMWAAQEAQHRRQQGRVDYRVWTGN